MPEDKVAATGMIWCLRNLQRKICEQLFTHPSGHESLFSDKVCVRYVFVCNARKFHLQQCLCTYMTIPLRTCPGKVGLL